MNLVVDACVFVAEQIEDQREFAAADAVARGAVVEQHVRGHPADQGQVFRRSVVARPAGALAKLHARDSVLLIFDAPAAAHRGLEADFGTELAGRCV